MFGVIKAVFSAMQGKMKIEQAVTSECETVLAQADDNIVFQKLQTHLYAQGFSIDGEPFILKSSDHSSKELLFSLTLAQRYRNTASDETANLIFCLKPNGSKTTNATVYRGDHPCCWFEVDRQGEIQTIRESILSTVLSRIQSPILMVVTAVTFVVLAIASTVRQLLRRSDA